MPAQRRTQARCARHRPTKEESKNVADAWLTDSWLSQTRLTKNQGARAFSALVCRAPQNPALSHPAYDRRLRNRTESADPADSVPAAAHWLLRQQQTPHAVNIAPPREHPTPHIQSPTSTRLH